MACACASGFVYYTIGFRSGKADEPAALARARGLGGVISEPSSSFCKHPPVQVQDSEAHLRLEAFIKGEDFDAAQASGTRH